MAGNECRGEWSLRHDIKTSLSEGWLCVCGADRGAVGGGGGGGGGYLTVKPQPADVGTGGMITSPH